MAIQKLPGESIEQAYVRTQPQQFTSKPTVVSVRSGETVAQSRARSSGATEQEVARLSPIYQGSDKGALPNADMPVILTTPSGAQTTASSAFAAKLAQGQALEAKESAAMAQNQNFISQKITEQQYAAKYPAAYEHERRGMGYAASDIKISKTQEEAKQAKIDARESFIHPQPKPYIEYAEKNPQMYEKGATDVQRPSNTTNTPAMYPNASTSIDNNSPSRLKSFISDWERGTERAFTNPYAPTWVKLGLAVARGIASRGILPLKFISSPKETIIGIGKGFIGLPKAFKENPLETSGELIGFSMFGAGLSRLKSPIKISEEMPKYTLNAENLMRNPQVKPSTWKGITLNLGDKTVPIIGKGTRPAPAATISHIGITDFKYVGKEYVPASKIVEPKVLSGETKFPTSKEPARALLQEFKTGKYALEGEGIGGWHATTARIAKETKTQAGTSESPGLYVAPSLSKYFLRTGGDVPTSYTPFGFFDKPQGGPSALFIKTSDIARIPKSVRAKGIGAMNEWLAKEAAKDKGYISPAFERGKTEKEAIIPPETLLTRQDKGFWGFERYTVSDHVKVPIKVYDVAGLKSVGKAEPFKAVSERYTQEMSSYRNFKTPLISGESLLKSSAMKSASLESRAKALSESSIKSSESYKASSSPIRSVVSYAYAPRSSYSGKSEPSSYITSTASMISGSSGSARSSAPSSISSISSLASVSSSIMSQPSSGKSTPSSPPSRPYSRTGIASKPPFVPIYPYPSRKSTGSYRSASLPSFKKNKRYKVSFYNQYTKKWTDMLKKEEPFQTATAAQRYGGIVSLKKKKFTEFMVSEARDGENVLRRPGKVPLWQTISKRFKDKETLREHPELQRGRIFRENPPKGMGKNMFFR